MVWVGDIYIFCLFFSQKIVSDIGEVSAVGELVIWELRDHPLITVPPIVNSSPPSLLSPKKLKLW